MKNLFILALVAGMFVVASCGGKKDNKEQARLDSLKKDSIMKDSIAKVEAEQLKADSIAAAQDTTKKEEAAK